MPSDSREYSPVPRVYLDKLLKHNPAAAVAATGPFRKRHDPQ